MQKRVLIFSLAYYPHLVGGAEVAIKEITDRIPPGEIIFDMVTLYAGASRYEEIGNVRIHRVGPKIHITGASMPSISYFIKFQYVAMAFSKALLLQRKHAYDFIWSVMASFNGFSALFFKLVHPRIPFLLSLQEGDSLEHIKKSLGIMYAVYVKIFKKADHIHAISTFLEKFGKDMGAVCPSIVIPNGVNFKFFSAKPPVGQLSALAYELDIDPFDTVLITTSRLVQKNAVEDIIDALTHLPEHVKLLILGVGPLEKFLREKTILLRLEKRVRFVGFVMHKELPLYMRISHIFVRPSLSEGMGVSFVEAMAADLPVIATPVGGIPDFLRDRETGLFARVNDPASIAEKVELLLNNSKLRESLVKNARDMVREKYEWDNLALEYRELFATLVV